MTKFTMNGGYREWLVSLICLLAWASVSRAADTSILFGDHVMAIDLKIELIALQQLAEKPQEFVRAQLRCWDQAYSPVGVCLRPQVQEVLAERNPSFLIKVDHFVPGQELGGVREFSIEQSVFDRSLMDRFCASRLASRIGVACPIYSHARLSLNGRQLGVYSVVERVNGDFLARISGSRAGYLLDSQQFEFAGESRSGADAGNQPKAFLHSLQSALQKKGQDSLPALADVLDLNHVFRFLAWEAFIRNTAGYSRSGSNGWMHVSDQTKKGILLPGEMFRLFTAAKMSVLGGNESKIARRLLETTEGRHRFLNEVASIATNSALEKEMVAEVEQRAALLTRHLSSAAELRGFESHVTYLEKRIRDRFEQVRKQVKEFSELSAVEFASLKLPRVNNSDFVRPNPLPLTTELPDYAAQLRQLIASSTILTSSLPVKIYEIALSASSNQLENLDWQATNWISVTALCDGRQFDKVGFRLKGHGSREGLRGKPNFTLKFNLEVKDQEFEGNTKVHFQNAALNASMLNEYLASWLFHRAGLPCPRVNFAHLTVNGVDYGILVVVEGTTKAFLRREFGEGEGLLFEGEYSDVNGRLDLDSGVIPPGYDGLQRLSEGAVQALQSGSDQLLTNCLNLPQFTRFTAAEIALGHVDGYAISANNYRFYQSTKDHRFQFIPHGMDRLALDHRSVTPVMKGILANVLLRLPAGRDAYFVGVKVFL